MAARGGDQNDAVSSPTSTVTLTSPSLSSTRSRNSLHAPPQPTLPIEIVEEIIIRLPVKFLSQLRCVCKSWNSLISDPKFARRHLRRLNRRILLVHFLERFSDRCSYVSQFMSYPLLSILNGVTTGGTQLDNPLNYGNRDYSIMGSCDGIICCCNFSIEPSHSFVVWNPSIRKFWELPPLENRLAFHSYGFGYDHLLDRFKLVVIFYYNFDRKSHVMVHTLGSNSWRRIEDLPCIPYRAYCVNGKFVSGALNWFAGHDDSNLTQGIISLDLGRESYQEFLQPDYGIEVRELSMDVMRDCLCILANSDVWVMKEYGNNESWTKLFSFPFNFFWDWNTYSPYHLGSNSLCVCEDDESIFYFDQNFGIYNDKSGTFRRSVLESKSGLIKNVIYDIYVEIESLISPFPQS